MEESFVGHSNNELTTLTLLDGGQYRLVYDGRGYVTKAIDPAGRETRFSINSSGDLTSIHNPDGTTKYFTYDNHHRLISEVTEDGKTTQYEYVKGKVVKEINEGGRVRNILPEHLVGALDLDAAKGRTVKAPIVTADQLEAKVESLGGDCVTRMFFLDSMAIDRQTNCLGDMTRYGSNRAGQITLVRSPEQRVTSYVYDDFGRVVESNDEFGKTRFWYDAAQSQVGTIWDQDNQMTAFARNTQGLVTKMFFPGNITVDFAYNPSNLVERATDNEGHSTSYDFDDNQNSKSITDALNNKTEFTRDSFGNIIEAKDVLGRKTTFSYDLMNRLVATKDALGFETELNYTLDGKLRSVENAKGQVTSFEYANNAHKVSKVVNPAGQEELFSYDANERLIEKTNKDGSTIHFGYDLVGRLISKESTAYVYDKDGLLTQVTNPDSEINLRYDSLGRLVEANQNGTSVTYTYTASGRRSGIKVDDTINLNYTYNERGQVTGISGYMAGHTVDYARSYDSLGRLEAERLPNEMMSYREYDELSRIKKITNGSSIFEYSYSANGNVTSIIHDGKQTDYGYDNIDRLVSSSDEKAFSYDAIGNHTNNGQVHNNLNQLLSDNEYGYTYTVNGNLSTKTNRRTNEIFEYSWDVENKLTGVAIKKNSATIKTISFKYDGLGRRIEKTVVTQAKTITRKFIYDNEDIIMELDGDDAVVAVYLHGPGIDEPIAMLRDTKGTGTFTLYAYSKDHLGSVREMRDQNQKLIQSYNYSAYGRTKVARHDIAGSVEFIENPFTFTAREWQPETGDIYYRARTYNSIMMRWLSEDSLAFVGLSLNRYAYVSQNPLLYSDPSGHIGFLAAIGVGAIVGGAIGMVGDMLFNDNWTGSSLVDAAISGAAGGATAAFTAGSSIVAIGGVTILRGVTSAGFGVAIGAAINLLFDPSSIPHPFSSWAHPRRVSSDGTGDQTCRSR